MADTKSFYITTAISYINGPPHMGHGYEALATDVIARFKRLDGYDVFFLTGTDEHGIKVLKTAREEGITAQELAGRITPMFQDMVKALNCSNDDFIRTTEERHIRSCEEIWRRMEANGDIYLDKYAGWYSVRDEAYYDESELRQARTARSCRHRTRRSSGSRKRATSSNCPPIRTSSRPLRAIRSSSAPMSGATRS